MSLFCWIRFTQITLQAVAWGSWTGGLQRNSTKRVPHSSTRYSSQKGQSLVLGHQGTWIFPWSFPFGQHFLQDIRATTTYQVTFIMWTHAQITGSLCCTNLTKLSFKKTIYGKVVLLGSCLASGSLISIYIYTQLKRWKTTPCLRKKTKWQR